MEVYLLVSAASISFSFGPAPPLSGHVAPLSGLVASAYFSYGPCYVCFLLFWSLLRLPPSFLASFTFLSALVSFSLFLMFASLSAPIDSLSSLVASLSAPVASLLFHGASLLAPVASLSFFFGLCSFSIFLFD